MSIRTFTREQLEAMGLPSDIVPADYVAENPEYTAEYPGAAIELHREHVESRRWEAVNELVFRAPDDGKAYLVYYCAPLTEMQDSDPWDYETTVDAAEVELRSVVRQEWLPINQALPTSQGSLRDRIAAAIRDAACTGDCGETEEECAKERIQPFAWHHGRLAVVEGSPEQFADAVLAELPAPVDRTEYDTLVREADRLRRDGAALHARAEGIDKQLAALRQQVAAPADRAAVFREAADAVFALEYDVMVGEEGDENLGSMREAWDVGTIHASQLLRRMADETAATETQARDCPACDAGIGHSEHCPTPESHKWGCGCHTETQPEPAVIVHACPGPDDNGFSPCCKRPPFEFRGERLTRDPDKVTCTGPAAGARQDGVQP